MRTVKVNKKGQATIPAEIREELGIKEGDELAVKVIEDKVVFKRVPTILELSGTFSGKADVTALKKEIDKMR